MRSLGYWLGGLYQAVALLWAWSRLGWAWMFVLRRRVL